MRRTLTLRLRARCGAWALLLTGCGTASPLGAQPPARPRPPTTTAPAPAPAGLPANAEDALLQRLSAPLSLHARAVPPQTGDCESLVLTASSADRTQLRQSTTINPNLELHGGALQHSALLTYFRIHGQSARSLLMNGREWFFEREACLASREHSPSPGVVDAARRFWDFEGGLFAPIVEPGGLVECRAMDVSRARDGSLAALRGSAMRAYHVTRVAAGMTVSPSFGPVRVGPEAVLVVHGFDDDSFYVSGSRWFKSEAACASGRVATKPVNFDPNGLESDEPGAFGLESSYHRVDTGGSPRVCAEVRIAKLTPTIGRVVMNDGDRRREWDFDFYPPARALWLGPEHRESGPGDRFAGELRVLTKEPDQLRAGAERWFETAAACSRGGTP